MNYKDITGMRFGRLVVIKYIGNQNCVCKCDCGTITTTRTDSVKRGSTRSCGCLRTEMTKERSAKHGDYKERLYGIWSHAKSRCNNTNNTRYSDYGGRGIKICDEWNEDYARFKDWSLKNGYKENLTLDRIDNNGNYTPQNCRWATAKQQQRNTNRNRIITFNGESHCVPEWSEITGLPIETIRARLKRKWNIDRLMTQPLRQRSR